MAIKAKECTCCMQEQKCKKVTHVTFTDKNNNDGNKAEATFVLFYIKFYELGTNRAIRMTPKFRYK